jgi:hypothetical protein
MNQNNKTYTLEVGPNPGDYWPEVVEQVGRLVVRARGDATLEDVVEAVGRYNPGDPAEGVLRDDGFADLASSLDGLGLSAGDTFIVTGGTHWRAEVVAVEKAGPSDPLDPQVDDSGYWGLLHEELDAIVFWDEWSPPPDAARRVVVRGWVRDTRTGVREQAAWFWREEAPLSLGQLYAQMAHGPAEDMPRDRGRLLVPVTDDQGHRTFEAQDRERDGWWDLLLESLPIRRTPRLDPQVDEPLEGVAVEFQIEAEVFANAAWVLLRGIDVKELAENTGSGDKGPDEVVTASWDSLAQAVSRR